MSEKPSAAFVRRKGIAMEAALSTSPGAGWCRRRISAAPHVSAGQFAQAATNRALDRSFDRPAIVESNLRLCRMDVDVDVFSRNDELEEHGRPHTGRYRRPVRRFSGADET